MDTTITLSVSEDTSPGMAASALSMAATMLEGRMDIEPGAALDSVIRDLRNLRNKIIEAQQGN